jgi:hypothetical protein
MFGICHKEDSSKQERLILNATYQLLVFADDVNLLGGCTRTVNSVITP